MNVKVWRMGAYEALPLLSGYLPVALSFGLIASQAGLSPFEATALSLLIYAGASQFLFVGMIASGAPLWLTVLMTLLINARHTVYAISLAPWVSQSRRWPWLMHGLTDQVFALAHYRLPLLNEGDRMSWFSSTAIVAWLGWAGGTLMGSLAGEQLMQQWPLLAKALSFALPALFLVLLEPRCTSICWGVSLLISAVTALLLGFHDMTSIAVPVAAAALGTLLIRMLPLYWMQRRLARTSTDKGEATMPAWPGILAPLMIAALLGLSLTPQTASAMTWGATTAGSLVTLACWYGTRTLAMPVAAGVASYALVLFIGC